MSNNSLTKKEEKQLNKMQADIHYCLNCQPWDSGDYFWVMGEQYGIEDLFDRYKLEEGSRDQIIQKLTCPNCGNELERYCEIGLEDPDDKEINAHIDAAIKKYGKKIDDFKKITDHHPTLALQSSLAKNILKEIKNGKIKTCSIDGYYFRARTLSDSKVFTSDDFLAPPLGKSQEGRFNHAGQNHFYIADHEETAINECLSGTDPSLIWVQQFKFKKINNILDLSSDWDDQGPSTSTLLVALHNTAILKETKNNKEMWKPDYNITRFIMDCAKQNGYSGIKYNSVKDHIGKNVVLFECKQDEIEDYEKPKIMSYDPRKKVDMFNRIVEPLEKIVPTEIF